MNFIQYIDDTYSLKVKALEEIILQDGSKWYFVEKIDTEFFIVAVYLNSKRVDGVKFIDIDNLFQTSFINDLSMSDLNVIPRNHFFYQNQVVNFTVNQSDISTVTKVKNTSVYGIVRPTFKTVTFQNDSPSTFKTLYVKNLGNSANTRLLNLIFPNGVSNDSLMQFPALQSYNNNRLLPPNSKVVQLDDIFCTVDLLGNENQVVEFRIECDTDNNHINLSFSDKYMLSNLVSNFGSGTVWKFTLSALDNDYNVLFNFDLYLDWKKPYILP